MGRVRVILHVGPQLKGERTAVGIKINGVRHCKHIVGQAFRTPNLVEDVNMRRGTFVDDEAWRVAGELHAAHFLCGVADAISVFINHNKALGHDCDAEHQEPCEQE